MPGHRVGVPRWRMRRTVVRGILAALVAGGFGLFLRTSHTDVARGAAPAVVTLEVWPAGQGRIEATQSGTPVAMTQSGDAVAPPGTCDFSLNLRPLLEALPCVATVAAGVPVTFMAFPEASVTGPNALPDPLPNSQFKRWTVSGCDVYVHACRRRLGQRHLLAVTARGRHHGDRNRDRPPSWRPA